jgi:two-component system, chemotaxis family, response regulator Rcp1
MKENAIRILWAEDSISDILLIKEAFQQAGFVHKLTVVDNGADATDYLFKRGLFANAAHPDLIILDMNMPRKNGREVMEEIRAEPTLLRIPVVILTSSTSDQNILEGLDPKRCLYLVKPTTFVSLVDLAKEIHNFWLSLADQKQD